MFFSLRKGLVVINFEEAYDTINHISLFNDAARELSRDYNNSSFDFNTSTFNLYNTLVPQRCTITPGNIVIEYDNLGTIDTFNKLALSTLQVLRDRGILSKFNRIGYRTFWGKDYDSIVEANNALIKSFNIDTNIICKYGDFNNLRYGFSANENIYQINYNFTSAINKEIKIFNGTHVSEELKNTLLADIDIYIENECKYSSIFTYMTNFLDSTKNKIEMFEKMIER